MTTSVLNVGDEVERVIDGEWFSATVIDITEIEIFNRDGSSESSYTYDLQYSDDQKTEVAVDRMEIRPRLLPRTNHSSPASDGTPSKPEPRQTTIPAFFPGNVERYKRALPSRSHSPSPSTSPMCSSSSSGGNISEASDAAVAPAPMIQERACISLNVFRQILKEFSRPFSGPALLRSRDECCDRYSGDGPSHPRHRLRRHSFATPVNTVGARGLPITTQYSPFAGRCEVCQKWTIYRCQRCSKAFYCSRNCQAEAWSTHNLCCEEREFRILLNYDKIESRHRQLTGLAAPDDSRSSVSSARARLTSMNPLHATRDDRIVYNTCRPISPPVYNSIPVNMNAGLARVEKPGETEIEMTPRESWYDKVKQNGSKSCKLSGTDEAIIEEDPEDAEVNGYAADNDSNPDFELQSPALIGPQPANFVTPPRNPKNSANSKANDKFSAEDAANLAVMLNVHVEAAVDALRRNAGDANAAAEWLLSMPTYVAVNSAAVHPEPSKPSGHAFTYPSNDIKVVEADLDGESSYVVRRKPVCDEDDDLNGGIELYSGPFSIRGRSCDVIVTQRSYVDYTTTITIFPQGHCELCPRSTTNSCTAGETKTLISSSGSGVVERTTIMSADIKTNTLFPSAEGVPAGFQVVFLPPPPTLDMNAIDDDIYSAGSFTSRPRDHVLMVQHSSLELVLQSSCSADGSNWEGFMDMSEASNFQRARRLLQSIVPQFVNPFGAQTMSATQLTSTIPIGGMSRFPQYYILVYKVFESNKVLSAQSVRPERVYIHLGEYDTHNFASVLHSVEVDRNELFKGSRTEPAPILSTNPFDNEPRNSYDDNDIPDLIDVSTETAGRSVIKDEDIQMIIDMFGLPPSEARSYLERANGSIEAAANLILS